MPRIIIVVVDYIVVIVLVLALSHPAPVLDLYALQMGGMDPQLAMAISAYSPIKI